MKKRTTIADVARRAGVSIMSVSRAVNNKPGVSKEMHQKILEVAAELDYLPNRIARSLATNLTYTVGMLVPTIANPFYALIAQGIEEVANENGYSVFIVTSSKDVAREVTAMDSLLAHEIDGAILCSLRLPQSEMIEIIQRFPAVVLFNRELENPLPNVVTISVNDQRAAQEAVQRFLEQGRRRIAYIGAPEDSVPSNHRLEGYRAALENAGVPFDPALVMHIMPGLSTGEEAAARLMAYHPDIDAILAFNDQTAAGVLMACRAAGKKVPGDIAIFGADDIPLASLISPQLSTSRVNLAHVGQLAMRTLLKLMDGEASPASYLIEPELVLRESG